MSLRQDQRYLESRDSSGAHVGVDLLSRLIDIHFQQAVIVCDRWGEVLWENEIARNSAEEWGVLECRNANVLVVTRKIQCFFGDVQSGENPVNRFLARGPHFLELSLLSVDQGDVVQVGLTVDCHRLENCGDHSLEELSRAEYRLLKSMESHRCLKEAASSLGISYENARTKLKRIFEKLDVHSQAELMSKVQHISHNSAPPAMQS